MKERAAQTLALEAVQESGQVRKSSPYRGADSHPISKLHQAIGNRAIQRVIQEKLATNQPGDVYEQDADRLAEQVLLSAPSLTPLCKCACGGTTGPSGECEECRAKRLIVQRSAVDSARPSTIPPIVDAELRSPGQPLDPATRAFMESRFRRDFRKVRIHVDGSAPEAAHVLRARAFASGQDIVFGAAQYAPETIPGKQLLAHELTHVVQQSQPNTISEHLVSDPGDMAEGEAKSISENIQEGDPRSPHSTPAAQINRQAVTVSSLGAAADAPPPGFKSHQFPTTGETVTIDGVPLSENPDQLEDQMTNLIVNGHPSTGNGLEAPRTYLRIASKSVEACESIGAPKNEICSRREVIKTKIIPVLGRVVNRLFEKHRSDLENFERQAKANSESALQANEEQIKAEGIRYGITATQTEKIRIHATGEGPKEKESVFETHYNMQEASPAGKGLQAGAKVLLERQRKIDELRHEQNSHLKLQRDPFDPKGRILVPDEQYSVIAAEVEHMINGYNDLRDYLSNQYPALAAFSDITKANDNLRRLAEKGTGPDMAALIGSQIAEKLGNIEQVRRGLGPEGGVNVWRLAKIVDLTKAQLGVTSDPVQNALIVDKVKQEQPGILADIAVLVLNVAAIALAGATGGISLVVAAGVNVAVATAHVDEFLTKESLVGSAFHKAQALSQEEPSLFWLAVEIVGTAVDVGTAALTIFKTLKPLVKAALLGKEGKEATDTAQALRAAAKDAKGTDFANRVVAQVQVTRKGEAAALEGVTKTEANLLQEAGKAAKLEAAAEIGKSAAGEIHISKAGHLFSCSSPCQILREKYAKIFGQDAKLEKRLIDLEGRAQSAAKAGDKVAAKAVAEEAALLNRELRGIQIESTLKVLASKYKILQSAGLDPSAINRVVAKVGDIGQMKGQLLEELLASRVKSMLGTEAGRTALAGESAAAKLEFFEGHRITDAAGRQFTDGVIAIRNGDKIQIVTILESKAGRASSRGLKYSYTSLKDLSEEELKILRAEAIEELREQNKAMADLSTAEINSKFPKEVEKMMNELPKGEAGQVQKDIERLVPNVGQKTTTIKIDGKEVQAIGGAKSTKTIGVLPSDVSGAKMEAGFQADGLRFESMNLDIKQIDLKNLANDLASALVASP